MFPLRWRFVGFYFDHRKFNFDELQVCIHNTAQTHHINVDVCRSMSSYSVCHMYAGLTVFLLCRDAHVYLKCIETFHSLNL